ncbi:MAG: rhodanese-like domain-containing protein [Candidatus Marinimicrobia bacterium]|nr:rhodanese-like domain-containing protein [Candidatus Neomarinimicrobiota bacterium]
MNCEFIKPGLKRLVLFGLIMIGTGFLYNMVSPNGIPLIIKTSKIKVGDDIHKIPVFQGRNDNKPEPIEISDITPVDLEKAIELFHQTGPLFIDVRSAEEYAQGHIPGALNFPLESLENGEIDLLNLEPDQVFVCYCNDPDCDLSLKAAVLLQEQGFTNIFYFAEGWNDWINDGNQVSRGTKP